MILDDAGEQVFICFEHSIVYKPSDLICWVCENEIAEKHDPLYKEKVNESGSDCGSECFG